MPSTVRITQKCSEGSKEKNKSQSIGIMQGPWRGIDCIYYKELRRSSNVILFMNGFSLQLISHNKPCYKNWHALGQNECAYVTLQAINVK